MMMISMRILKEIILIVGNIFCIQIYAASVYTLSIRGVPNIPDIRQIISNFAAYPYPLSRIICGIRRNNPFGTIPSVCPNHIHLYNRIVQFMYIMHI